MTAEYTLKDKVALVTGASRGIGKAIALELAKEGAHVICVSKSTASEAVASAIQQAGGSAASLSIDVADRDAVNSVSEKILEKHGSVDILVNNAGITNDKLLIQMSFEDWDSVLQTNLYSVFYWTQALLRPMTKKRWGRVINIASVVGLMGNAGQFNYSAAKAGMLGATKSLAKEVAGRNITVNAIAPGFIETDMTAAMPERAKEHVMAQIPLKRMGTAENIADAVAFLASEKATYITGQVLCVDGGMVM